MCERVCTSLHHATHRIITSALCVPFQMLVSCQGTLVQERGHVGIKFRVGDAGRRAENARARRANAERARRFKALVLGMRVEGMKIPAHRRRKEHARLVAKASRIAGKPLRTSVDLQAAGIPPLELKPEELLQGKSLFRSIVWFVIGESAWHHWWYELLPVVR